MVSIDNIRYRILARVLYLCFNGCRQRKPKKAKETLIMIMKMIIYRINQDSSPKKGIC